MSSRAACAAAPSSASTKPPRPSPRRSSAPRTSPASTSRASPSPPAGGQLTSNRVAGRVSIGAWPISRPRPRCGRSGNALAQIKLPGRRAAHILPISWSVDGRRRVRDPRAMFGRDAGRRAAGGLGLRSCVPDTGRLCRARAPAVRGRRRCAVRLGAGRAGRRRDGPGLRLHRHGRRLDERRGVHRRLLFTSRPCRSAAST